MRSPLRRASGWTSLPTIAAFVAVGIAVSLRAPDSLSYNGASLLLAYTVPLALASLAEMIVIGLGDIDLSIGPFVGLVNALCVTVLYRHALVGILVLVGCVLAYVAMGVLIEIRRLPAILVTLGASFVWTGLGVVILPTPGGTAPTWLVNAVNYNPPLVPLPVVLLIVFAVILKVLLVTSFGVRLRAVGSNVQAVRGGGLSVLKVRASAYGLAGLLGVIAGLVITGNITSGDSTVSASYTLLAIAAVILGGGEFIGGRISAAGAVLGATTLSLLASFLTLVNIPSNYQVGLDGVMLLGVLLLRWVRLAAQAHNRMTPSTSREAPVR